MTNFINPKWTDFGM